MGKKYGIKIYFNLHYAPTNNFGYHGYSMWKLNDNTNNMTNRNKVREMWEALAERYSNEDTILGWGLMNEPVPYYQDGKTLDEMLQPWVNTAKLFRDAIRKYDNNHILFVEPSEMLNNNGKYISYTSNRRVLTRCVDLLYTQVFKKDNNYCFEYHWYSLWSFSSKGVSGTTFQPLTENTLKARSDYLKTISDYIKKNSTPFLGEFGVSLQTMPCKGYEDKLTGIDFVNTTLDFCKEENVSFNYHQYRDNIFGLHSSSYKIMDNQDLYDIFKARLFSLYDEKLNNNEEVKTPNNINDEETKTNKAPSEIEDNEITTETVKVSKENSNTSTSNSSYGLPKTSGFDRANMIEISALIIIILALVGVKIRH